MHPLESITGALLVGHGTRSDLGTRQFLALARMLADAIDPVPAEPAFLELQQPDIAAGIRRLLERGVSDIVTVPSLLFEAGHARQDIPEAVRRAARGEIRVAGQSDPLGCHPSIVECSRQRLDEAIFGRPQVAAERTCLLLVGRGSRDAEATAEMHEFAAKRRESCTAAETVVAFAAMAEPALDRVLPQVAAQGFERVVVQPHLLFHGELYDGIARKVESIARAHPRQEWIVTSVLGDEPESPGPASELLCEVLIERFGATMIRVAANRRDH
jgi:sirohydrochlorin cobaltochelatase